MIDADTIEPKTPHLEGNLRGSKKVGLVENSKKEFSIEFGFDQPYAGALHEREKPTNWSEEGVGPKYLQSKLARFMDKYKRIFGLAIKRGKK
ncbi:MAG: hypothetical protein KAW12_07250 [Candidatus Aminicenantes bacterium]|nr:hypothetical protein [Candidatus Aminicenantes bacterium]